MPRTLPWLKNGAAKASALVAHPKPSKRQRMLDPDSDSESTILPHTTTAPPPKTHAPLSPHKQKTLLTTERSPSTSPPPAPPTEEPMRPGLSADDIYIMVEDEFLSTARAYTAHLHHAEYIRLKNEAKKRNSATITSISRPVDSITTMRAETKKRKEAEAQDARTKAGVESVMARKRPGTASDESEFDGNEGQDQPWEGTQLQRFMNTSPRKALTSLTGLQGVTSHTRAAAGFERSEQKGENKATIARAEDDTSEDDDDLGAPSRAPSRVPARLPAKNRAVSPPSLPRPKAEAKLPSPPRPPPRRSLLDMSPPPAPPSMVSTKVVERSRRRPDPANTYDSIDEPRPSVNSEEIRARRRRIQARKERAEKEEGKSGGGIAADEIPIFLV